MPGEILDVEHRILGILVNRNLVLVLLNFQHFGLSALLFALLLSLFLTKFQLCRSILSYFCNRLDRSCQAWLWEVSFNASLDVQDDFADFLGPEPHDLSSARFLPSAYDQSRYHKIPWHE